MYHGIARSNGMNYWQSMAYTFAGSAFWKVFGETTTPSRNDQISTGIGGSFLFYTFLGSGGFGAVR